MKKVKITITDILIMIAIMITIIYTFLSFAFKLAEPSYQRDMAVVEIELEEDGTRVLVLEDINGFTWDYATDNYKIGDTVVAYFHDNNTSETIFDDEILRLETLCIANY